MLAKLEIIEIGNSLGVILPPVVLNTLNAKAGDTLLATVVEGSVLLTVSKDEDAY